MDSKHAGLERRKILIKPGEYTVEPYGSADVTDNRPMKIFIKYILLHTLPTDLSDIEKVAKYINANKDAFLEEEILPVYKTVEGSLIRSSHDPAKNIGSNIVAEYIPATADKGGELVITALIDKEALAALEEEGEFIYKEIREGRATFSMEVWFKTVKPIVFVDNQVKVVTIDEIPEGALTLGYALCDIVEISGSGLVANPADKEAITLEVRNAAENAEQASEQTVVAEEEAIKQKVATEETQEPENANEQEAVPEQETANEQETQLAEPTTVTTDTAKATVKAPVAEPAVYTYSSSSNSEPVTLLTAEDVKKIMSEVISDYFAEAEEAKKEAQNEIDKLKTEIEELKNKLAEKEKEIAEAKKESRRAAIKEKLIAASIEFDDALLDSLVEKSDDDIELMINLSKRKKAEAETVVNKTLSPQSRDVNPFTEYRKTAKEEV